VKYYLKEVFAGLLLVMAIGGCAPFVQYRTQYELCENSTTDFPSKCEAHAIQTFPAADGASYLLGFIEFDDQGQLWDRKQMQAVLNTLSTEAAHKDLLMAIFVHGWKHSAAPNDKDIKTFRKVLAGLSEGELQVSRQAGRPARQVAGIYLGWRGGSVTIPVADELTFWERKNTAQKVGQRGVTEVLSRLELIKRTKDSIAEGNSTTRLVVVGHSFGGSIVHSSLIQILEDRFVRTKERADSQIDRDPDLQRDRRAGFQTDIEGFGNLVVLINPAFEALQFAQLSDMSTERGKYFESQLPLIAILTSEADRATRNSFPIGRYLSTLFENDRDITRWNAVTRQQEIIHEGKANVTAIGHFQPYQTHKLYPSSKLHAGVRAQLSSTESVNSASKARTEWETDTPGSKISIAGLTLERGNTSAGRNPYLVVSVNRNIITNHNHINDERIIEFIKQLILISALP